MAVAVALRLQAAEAETSWAAREATRRQGEEAAEAARRKADEEAGEARRGVEEAEAAGRRREEEEAFAAAEAEEAAAAAAKRMKVEAAAADARQRAEEVKAAAAAAAELKAAAAAAAAQRAAEEEKDGERKTAEAVAAAKAAADQEAAQQEQEQRNDQQVRRRLCLLPSAAFAAAETAPLFVVLRGGWMIVRQRLPRRCRSDRKERQAFLFEDSACLSLEHRLSLRPLPQEFGAATEGAGEMSMDAETEEMMVWPCPFLGLPSTVFPPVVPCFFTDFP